MKKIIYVLLFLSIIVGAAYAGMMGEFGFINQRGKSGGDAILWDASGDKILWDDSGDAILWD